ncbi:MAG TPA: hypothetical protein PLQ56_23015 [Aggregatilineales bacterium]|nr:hypothetical protein [Aggregatilineales bacterium]
MATRRQNEKLFDFWETLPDGGRRYWFDRKGFIWGFQRIIKIVDANEETVSVIQEVYNDAGELVEWHQKFPVDTGHQIIKPRDED